MDRQRLLKKRSEPQCWCCMQPLIGAWRVVELETTPLDGKPERPPSVICRECGTRNFNVAEP